MRRTPSLTAVSRRAPRALCCLSGVLLAACGAKTGLSVPDVRDVVEAEAEADVMRPEEICIEPQPDVREPVVVDLSTEAQVAVADVLFVIDRTGSMEQEIDNIRASLRTVIVPGLDREIPDLNLGVVTVGDFPVEPYGGPEDRAFALERRLDDQYTALQGALANIRVDSGGDNPEAQVEALYQIATGEGLGPFIPPAGGCPSVGVGYACFRPRATPIVIMITDAPFHNGPADRPGGASFPYVREAFAPHPPPHSYEQAIAALRARLPARVMGINSSGGRGAFSARPDLERLARDTNAVGEGGQPLVFDINPDGSGLGEQVVRAVGRFTDEVLLNVSARAVDLDGGGGADLIRVIRPVRAVPMDRVQRQDGTTFFGVVPGTQLVFAVEIDPARAMPTDREQRFRVRVEFLSDGRPTLGYRDVEIVIPGRQMRCMR